VYKLITADTRIVPVFTSRPLYLHPRRIIGHPLASLHYSRNTIMFLPPHAGRPQTPFQSLSYRFRHGICLDSHSQRG